jgi:hypothetical protein
MELEELDLREPCANCGTLVTEGTMPLFTFGEGEVLCGQCALRRGGSYDVERDQWVTAPKIDDLL